MQPAHSWKTFAYFFGAPAINAETNRAARPLDDTSEEFRTSARRDRWAVVAFQIGAPLTVFALGGWQALVLYLVLWVLPMLTVLQPILRLRAIAEHGAMSDLSSPLTAARYNRTGGSLPNLLGRAVLFPHHVNYHLEHHLYPAVRITGCPRCTSCCKVKACWKAPKCAISAKQCAGFCASRDST